MRTGIFDFSVLIGENSNLVAGRYFDKVGAFNGSGLDCTGMTEICVGSD